VAPLHIFCIGRLRRFSWMKIFSLASCGQTVLI
jgi:hypothetical protein